MQDEQNARKAERQARPLNPRDVLAHEAIGKGRGHDRLKPGYKRRDTSRYALTDRRENASKTEPVHQRARDEAMPDLIAVRPLGVPNYRDRGHDDHDKCHPHGQESQRLDIWQAITGANKPGTP